MCATGFEQHRRELVWPAQRHDQIGAAMVFVTDAPDDLPASDGPLVRAVGVAGESALVKIY